MTTGMNTDELARKIWNAIGHLPPSALGIIHEQLKPLAAERDHYKGMWQKYQQVYAERDSLRTQLEQAREVLRGLLMSSDCTWYERNEGHDWRESVDAAEAFIRALTPAKQPAEG